jgi:thiol-disulfide isomerase/thioredoxin
MDLHPLFRRAATILFGLVLLGAAVACGGEPAPTTAGSVGSGSPSASPTSLVPASPTALPEMTPAEFDTMLAEFYGKPVVVNYWASWCGPCTKEAPDLALMSGQYGPRVQFVGVDVQDQLQPARAFIEQYGWAYPSVFDPDAAIRNARGLPGLPITIVYDQVGHQIWQSAGAFDANELAQTLDAALEV